MERQRGADGSYVYYETIKRTVTGMKRVEIERRLTQKEYLKRLMDADTTRRQIRKTRYCLMYKNQYFEIDVYPFDREKAVLFVYAGEEKPLPPEISVIREVTGEAAYKNRQLAKVQKL